MFGVDFDDKINVPSGTWMAMKFASLIDPALQYDINIDKPWFLSPLLCSMNIANVMHLPTKLNNCAPLIGKNIDPNFKPTGSMYYSGNVPSTTNPLRKEVLGDWKWGDGVVLEESNTMLFSSEKSPSSFFGPTPIPANGISERRKHFQKSKNREASKFIPENLYNFEVTFLSY
jgi:hypothetical protein